MERAGYHLIILGLLIVFVKLIRADPAPVNCSVKNSFVSDEKRLLKCLLTDYDPAVRPAYNATDIVQVTLETTVIKVLDVDEKSHIMTTNGWIYHEWTDFQLQWNPDEFGGVKTIRIPVIRLWTPDIVLFNNADESYKYVVDKLALVSYTGSVVWVPHARLRSYCNLDLGRFPFDTQTCSLVFGSWTHDVTAVNVSIRNTTKGVEYMTNAKEWIINNVHQKRYQWTYQQNEMYAGIISTIEIKRVSSFYQYIFIMPTVMFAFLALLLPFVPPLSRERIILGVGLVLGCTMVLMMLENHMPTELGTVPVIAAYLAYVLVMVIVNIFFSILAINMSLRDPRHGKIPGWVRWIFLTKLNRLVCVSVEPYTALPVDLIVEETTAERELLDMRNGTSGNMTSGGEQLPLEQTMEEIRRYLRVMSARSASGPQHTHRELVIQEWRQVARVIDRLLFVCFLVLTIVITISMYSHY